MIRRAAALVLSMVLLLAAPAAFADPAKETEHVVTAGETLGGIANRAGVPLVVIAEANGLVQPYKVRLGQKLIIPRQRVHTVKSGETGLGIANRYGIALTQIAVANALEEPFDVRTGQRLIIPAMVTAPVRRAPQPATPYFRAPHDGDQLMGFAMREDGSGHDGIDYAANPLEMVRASASGTVLYSGTESERFGGLVVLDHGNGWQSAYGHLARLTVSTGDAVKAGERIGLAGSEGAASRTELHFEIRRDGKKIDPAELLQGSRSE